MGTRHLKCAWLFAAAITILPAAGATAEEEEVDDEASVPPPPKIERKVEVSMSYFVRPSMDGASRAGKAPAPKGGAKKGKAAETAKVEAASPRAGKPVVTLEVKGNKAQVTRSGIIVNRTIDLGVAMDVYAREIRLSEFVKNPSGEVGVEFDTIDVVSNVSGLEGGDHTLIYFDMNGREAYNGRFTVK
jgi:hypothetical protein